MSSITAEPLQDAQDGAVGAPAGGPGGPAGADTVVLLGELAGDVLGRAGGGADGVADAGGGAGLAGVEGVDGAVDPGLEVLHMLRRRAAVEVQVVPQPVGLDGVAHVLRRHVPVVTEYTRWVGRRVAAAAWEDLGSLVCGRRRESLGGEECGQGGERGEGAEHFEGSWGSCALWKYCNDLGSWMSVGSLMFEMC
ncbi:hypothetical protein PG997_000153 [Apiospora hydei]|uniref:Uncharacterized protein n=1 Tax=Apiospora hydei TaxID=1337664 RepID=A0ABR1XA43_9PEZI